jgi:hypothetical protein
MLNSSDTRGGSVRAHGASDDMKTSLFPPISLSPLGGGGGSRAANGTMPIGNNRAFVAGAFNWQFGNTDDAPVINNLLAGSTCPKFDITYLLDAQVTVDALKSLHKYGIVAITTHGDTYYRGIFSLWREVFGWNFWGGQVIFLTGQRATKANYPNYERDIRRGRVVIASGYYAVLPSFIEYYATERYPDSIVYNGSCRSLFNDSMANAFFAQGAKTYFGYTEYVNSAFAKARGTELFTGLVTHRKTTGESFIPGQKDNSNPPAFWVMRGANTMMIGDATFKNGGFEEGLKSWKTEGDGRAIAQLGTLTPTEGSIMGIISTGLGYTVATGSIAQSFCIPAGVTTLTFDANFLSEEFLEYCGSQYQDFFHVRVGSDALGWAEYLRVIDDLCGSVVPAPVSFDQGDVHQTGWFTVSLDVSSFAGAGDVTLVFAAGDIGDSIYDTAILIDNIRMN